MPERLTVLPDERFAALRATLLAALQTAARDVSGEAFGAFLDDSMRSLLLEGFHRVGADEGTVWLLNETKNALVPRFNSGAHADYFVGRFEQPLRSGMISMVAATEQPICENEVCRNERQDRTLDNELGLKTWAMLAVPFVYFSELRGVISCVQLLPKEASAPVPPGFSARHLSDLQHTAGLLSRLIEYRLLAQCLGLDALG